MAATIMALSLADNRLSAISMSFIPFRSIHIFATEYKCLLPPGRRRLFQWIKIVLYQIIKSIDKLSGIGVVPMHEQRYIQHVIIRS